MPARTKTVQVARAAHWLVLGVWCAAVFAGVLLLLLGDVGVVAVLIVVAVLGGLLVAGVRLQRWVLAEPCLVYAAQHEHARWWCCRCWTRASRRGLERPEPVPLDELTCPRCGHARCSDV